MPQLGDYIINSHGIKLQIWHLMPLIDRENNEPLVLQHFQAKPVNIRTFGYFQIVDDQFWYHTIAPDEIVIKVYPVPIQKEVVATLPTAVNVFRNAVLKRNGRLWSIENANPV